MTQTHQEPEDIIPRRTLNECNPITPITAWATGAVLYVHDRDGVTLALNMPNAAGAQLCAAAIRGECNRARRDSRRREPSAQAAQTPADRIAFSENAAVTVP